MAEPDTSTQQPGADHSVHDALADAEQSISDLQAEIDAAGMDAGGDALSFDRAGRIELLNDVDLHVTIELGRTEMLVEDVLKLGEGSVVELDKLAGDPVDVFVNGRHVARGEVLVLNDNFCIRISEIVADLREQAEAATEQIEAGSQ